MGFKSVYRMLMDVFPQVDPRILRAVAIENSKDADKAAEVVLMEVIPNIPSTSGSADDTESLALGNSTSREENTVHLGSKNLEENDELFKVFSQDDGNGNGDQACGSNGKQVESPVHVQSILDLSAILNYEDVPSNKSVVGSNVEQLCSNVNSLDVNTSPLKSNIIGRTGSTDDLSTVLNCEEAPCNLESLVERNLEQLYSNVNSLDVETSAVKLPSPAVLDCPSHASENDLQLANDNVPEETYNSLAIPLNYITAAEVDEFENEPIEEKSFHELIDFEHEGVENISTHEVVEFKDEPALNTEVSRSGHICRIDLLEDIITEAKDNKKTLFSAMETVMSLMKEVEVREKAVEQVKEEAAKEFSDILASVEDLKQMLRHAREANDMHAGEVYGEKAILATEAKELQSRLLCLSDERDNSLAILNEMRQTLEHRLDAAEKEMKAAEQEKMAKEEHARNALAEQQLIMDKLVQESKMLKQEAEENSKLQEFLMDRGRVVDMLQGEISVICQDVKLLKQKFDERVPLSESLSSSQTSCRLASSSSSVRSLPVDQVPVQIETALENAKRPSPTPSISDHLSSGEEIEANDCDAQGVDDGWELFDKKELNM